MARITVGVNEKGVRVGEDHQRATLTDHDVELMRQLREEGLGYKRLAKMFDTSVRNVRDIVNYKRRVTVPTAWKTVEG
jgi:transcriptional regulator